MALLIQQDTELWSLCKELESLGGGIKTRLESISLLNISKNDIVNGSEPPYLKHEQNGTSRQLKLQEIQLFLQNISRFLN